jgi:pyruvate kinase
MATLPRNLKLRLDLTRTNQEKQKLTKIVCTLGPKTNSVEMVCKLLDEGMDVARLNFSHGNHEYHGQTIDNIREALRKRREEVGRCAIMLDTKGPEIRTGKLEKGKIQLTAGKEIYVITDLTRKGDDSTIIIDYQELIESVKEGCNVLIADGNISLTIMKIDMPNKRLLCRCNNTAVLGETKNVHLPGAKITLPAISEKDRADLLFGLEKGVDAIAASFIRSADDVRQIREILGEKGKHIFIISKIESTEGIENFDEILKVSDGIMVARGDLGVEIPMEQIFVAQKWMISKCNAAGKPVITATQMLESMIQFPRPTRAEATDVANAVLDGSDAVMLSGETASGDYPLEAVRYMRYMCKEAERVEGVTDYPSLFEVLREFSLKNPSISEIMASYAVRIANDLKCELIIVFSETGSLVRLLIKYRPQTPVICVTDRPSTANNALFSRCVLPMLVTSTHGGDQIVGQAMERAKLSNLCKVDSRVVVVYEGRAVNSAMVKVLTVR